MGAIDYLQKAIEIARAVDNSDLVVALADSKSQYADVVTENASLKERVRQLETQLATRDELQFEDGAYWKGPRPEGDQSAQPFCPVCWENRSKQIHMQPFRLTSSSDYFQCPVCHINVDDPKSPSTTDPARQRRAIMDY